MPAGLKMNYTTGIISGTPIKLQPETLYTVTASNEGKLHIGITKCQCNRFGIVITNRSRPIKTFISICFYMPYYSTIITKAS
jgi:hypothetical protein